MIENLQLDQNFFVIMGDTCNSREAVANVERSYAVVGVMEEFYLSMQILEKMVPRFFAGAPQIYSKLSRNLGAVNKNIYQPKVDEKIKDLVRKNMTREVDFYNFCRQRLYKQYLLVKDELWKNL